MSEFNQWRKEADDTDEPEEEFVVRMAEDLAIGSDNFLEFNIDKVIERVNMLFHKSLDFEEGWEEVPFVLGGVYRFGQGFTVVKRLKKSIKALFSVSDI